MNLTEYNKLLKELEELKARVAELEAAARKKLSLPNRG